MRVEALQTGIFATKMNLTDFIIEHAGAHLRENQILAVTSKIVSLAEARSVSKRDIEKKQLIQRESDYYLGEIGYGCHLTIKHNLLIPSAGIDESNSAHDEYILYPRDPFASAQRLHQQLRERLGLQQLGILLTDSHTLPLRKGVVGAALAYWGFRGIRSMIGQADIFGRKLQMTQINVADALATAATFLMGEGAERCPLAILADVPVEFCEVIDPNELVISVEQDLYAPIYAHLLAQN